MVWIPQLRSHYVVCGPAGRRIAGPPGAAAAISALRQLWPGFCRLPPPSLLLSWLPHQASTGTHCLGQCSSSHLNVGTDNQLSLQCRQREQLDQSPLRVHDSTASGPFLTNPRHTHTHTFFKPAHSHALSPFPWEVSHCPASS